MIFLSIYTFQPNIIKDSFNTLKCKSFYPDPGSNLLKINLFIDCNSESYIYWIYFLIIPNLIIFGIIYPIISFLYVLKKKISFSNEENILKIGFFIQSYGINNFYWEQIFYIQKVIIIIIETFIEDIYQKSSLIAIIFLIFYYSHIKIKPLVTNNLNKLNIGCDLSLLLFILIKIFSNNINDNLLIYYFSFILCLIIKIFIIMLIMNWILKIYIFKFKNKIFKKFKSLERYLDYFKAYEIEKEYDEYKKNLLNFNESKPIYPIISLENIKLNKIQEKKIFFKQTIELPETKINENNNINDINIKLNDEISTKENLFKIILLQQEENNILKGKNEILSKRIQQLNDIITNKDKISINKTNKNTFNMYFKDLPVPDQQLESSISISNNSNSEDQIPEEIIDNEDKTNIEEVIINLSLLGIKYLDLPNISLKLEKSENLNKLPFFKLNNTQVNFSEFDFIELHGIFNNINQENIYDFKIICESKTEDIICCVWNIKENQSMEDNKFYEFDILVKLKKDLIKLIDYEKSIIFKISYKKKKENDFYDNFIQKIKLKFNNV